MVRSGDLDQSEEALQTHAWVQRLSLNTIVLNWTNLIPWHGGFKSIGTPARDSAFSQLHRMAGSGGLCNTPFDLEVYVGSVGHGVQWDTVFSGTQ